MAEQVQFDVVPGDLSRLEEALKRALLGAADAVASKIAKGVGGQVGGALTPGPGGGGGAALPTTFGGALGVVGQLGLDRFGAGAKGSFGGQVAAGLLGKAGSTVAAVVGAVMEVNKMVSEQVTKIANAPGDAARKVLTGVANGLRDLGGALGPIGAGLNVLEGLGTHIKGLSKGFETLSPLLSAGLSGLGNLIEGIAGPLQGVLMGAVELSAKANPATVERFKIAVADSAAVIGRVFVPVVETMTKAVRLLGDVFASILPSTGQMRDILSALDPLFNELRSLFQEIAPLLKVVVDLFAVELKGALTLVAFNVRLLVALIKTLPSVQLARMIPGAGRGLADSFGAAARPGSFSSVEDLGRQFQLAAVASGAPDVPAQQLKVQESMLSVLQQILAGAAAAPSGAAVAKQAIDALLRRR